MCDPPRGGLDRPTRLASSRCCRLLWLALVQSGTTEDVFTFVSTSENGDGDQLTVTVEPDPRSLGGLLGSEEGALVLELAS
jgi:hypothetical protein